jgi:hypothetical protein
MPKMPEPLPEDFTWGPFRYREAAEVGIPRSRLRQKDVIHAHHGIYVAAAAGPRNIVERCETLLPLLGERRWFSHGTAARLWGMPLPARESDDEVLHVLSVAGAQRMRRPGVRGWESAEP